MNKSRESLRFAHLMFWCILASMDDTQSIQMSQHKNKEVWEVLDMLMTSHDGLDSLEASNEFFKSFHKLPRQIRNPNDQGDNLSDTGGSSSYNYGHVEKLESHARMVRFDQ